MSRQAKFTGLSQFSDRLRDVRKRMGMNQTDFALLGGVVMNSQNRYEAGATEPGVAYLARLAEHEVDVRFLLTGKWSSSQISSDEAELVSHFRKTAKGEQRTLLDVSRVFAGLPAAETPDAATSSATEAAMAEMFEGLLEAIDQTLPVAERARQLAQLLPTALSQLKDLAPDPVQDTDRARGRGEERSGAPTPFREPTR